MIISLEDVKKYFAEHHPVACPTETVYGLCCPMQDLVGIDRVFAIKKRPLDNPLIVHVSGKKQLSEFLPVLNPLAEQLIERFWPGPLTLVLPCLCQKIPHKVRAGLSRAAFRCPSHPAMQALIKKFGPLVAPSCNLSGKPSATHENHVQEDFGEVFPIFQGGFCLKGLESTIVIQEASGFKIGRLGSLSVDLIEEVLGSPLTSIFLKDKALCPGQKYRHYAPECHLHLKTLAPNEAKGVVVGCSSRSYSQAEKVYPWGEYTDPETLARRLYSLLRQLDLDGVQEAWVDINFPSLASKKAYAVLFDRLKKAASKKSL